MRIAPTISALCTTGFALFFGCSSSSSTTPDPYATDDGGASPGEVPPENKRDATPVAPSTDAGSNPQSPDLCTLAEQCPVFYCSCNGKQEEQRWCRDYRCTTDCSLLECKPQAPAETKCCIKGSYYACPSDSLARACTATSNSTGCSANAGKNAECGGTSGGNLGDDCSETAACGNGLTCVYRGTATIGVCTHGCATINDCQDFPGWPTGTCDLVRNGTKKYCLPK